MNAPQNPTLSVVVAIVSDTLEPRADVGHLTGCLEALASQVDAPTMEVIVPYHEDVDGIEALRQSYPHVRFVPVVDLEPTRRQGGGREHHDTLRARGLAVAQGDLVGLIEDHARPDTRWCAEVVAAHRSACVAIGGAIENGIDQRLNWAVYFCDFGRYQNPLPAGDSPFASDANVSYKRAALEAIHETWEESFREVIVNGALISQGEKVTLSPEIVVYQHRSGLRFGRALRERFVWGRSYAATRNALLSAPKRLIYAALCTLLPGVLILRMTGLAWKRRRRFGEFLRALPFIVMLQASWSLGEGVGYLTGVRR